MEFLLVLCVALFIGMAKTGVHGTGMLAVPLLANVFGGQASSGVMLPMLLIADVFGVWYYHRHASWKHLRTLFPWAALGVALGTYAGIFMDDKVFRLLMAITIIISLVVMLLLEQGARELIPHQKGFGVVAGIAGGFTSMFGNLAGTVMAVYLLAMRLPKNVYIGTTAWFFLAVNWFKVPFHVWSWHTITWNTVIFDFMMTPAILAGAFLGVWVVRQLTDKFYRWFIIAMTLVAALFMLLK